MPSSAALASAPSFIFTKKGLVSVLVIRQAVSAARAGAAVKMAAAAAPSIALLKMEIFFTEILPGF